jgi:hypothetical protein
MSCHALEFRSEAFVEDDRIAEEELVFVVIQAEAHFVELIRDFVRRN